MKLPLTVQTINLKSTFVLVVKTQEPHSDRMGLYTFTYSEFMKGEPISTKMKYMNNLFAFLLIDQSKIDILSVTLRRKSLHHKLA